MENTTHSVTGDSASFESLNALLGSVQWEVGALVAPTCEPTDSDDSTEVR